MMMGRRACAGAETKANRPTAPRVRASTTAAERGVRPRWRSKVFMEISFKPGTEGAECPILGGVYSLFRESRMAQCAPQDGGALRGEVGSGSWLSRSFR